MAELLISATNANRQQVGEVVDTKPDGHEWGLREQPPNYVHLTITDATRDQVVEFIGAWDIKFDHELVSENATEYRVTVSVDPIYIAASGLGRDVIRVDMQTWAFRRYGAAVVGRTPAGLTVDIPKPVDLAQVKINFADHFNTVLGPRRYHFSAADVVTALAADGTITLTKAQALARVVDKLGL